MRAMFALTLGTALSAPITSLPGLAVMPSFKMYGVSWPFPRKRSGSLAFHHHRTRSTRAYLVAIHHHTHSNTRASPCPPTPQQGYVQYESPMLKSQHYTYHWIVESEGNPATDPILFWVRQGHRDPHAASPARRRARALTSSPPRHPSPLRAPDQWRPGLLGPVRHGL